MTEEQVKEAIELHDNQGLNWNIIAGFYSTTQDKIFYYRQKYELQNNVRRVKKRLAN